MAPSKSYMKAKPTKAELLDLAMKLMEEDDYQGVCHACGATADCCEPDACNYTCVECNAKQVFGAEETIMMLG
jgi:hypothetical protein